MTGTSAVRNDIADAYVAAFVSGDSAVLAGLCRPDVLVDLVVPHWRFQMVGRDALAASLEEGEFLPGRRVTDLHLTRTDDGILMEVETRAEQDGEECLWWMLHHVRVAADGVFEHIGYCSGILDSAQLARQVQEAPLVRSR